MGTDLRTVRLNQAPQHPCIGCGACCASFRVAFYWREANVDDTEKSVPFELTEDITDQQRCMKGTNTKHNPKCIALRGRVGSNAQCSIYQNRSTTCQNFEASWENGKHNPRCDQARARHGLKPLGREDYEVPGSENPKEFDHG